MVEQQTPLWCSSCSSLQQRLQANAMRVQRGDGVAALKQAARRASLHLVLLDPPFEQRSSFEPGAEGCRPGSGQPMASSTWKPPSLD